MRKRIGLAISLKSRRWVLLALLLAGVAMPSAVSAQGTYSGTDSGASGLPLVAPPAPFTAPGAAAVPTLPRASAAGAPSIAPSPTAASTDTAPLDILPPIISPGITAPPTTGASGVLAPTYAAPTNPSVPLSTSQTAAPPSADNATAPVAREIQPPVYYLPDKDGKLVPLLGKFTLEEFRQLYLLQQGLGQTEVRPRYNIQQFSLSGEARGGRAELTLVVKLQLLDEGLIGVPLRLSRAVMLEAPKHEGPGEHFLQPDAAQDGYVAWLSGGTRSQHQLTLKLALPLMQAAGDNRLELQLPRAASSRFSLRVPESKITASAAPSVLAVHVQPLKPGGSELSTLGLFGNCTIVWREAAEQAAKQAPLLEVNGLIYAQLDGRTVLSDATLKVRSYGGAFQEFRVRLPKGAQWTGNQHPGYTVVPVSGASGNELKVQLDEPTTEATEVRISCERDYDSTKPEELLELAGFQVIEALPRRQFGYLAVCVAGDWQVQWQQLSRLHQVELPENLQRKDLVAAFQYLGQPCSLTGRVTPRRTRISVEPEYVYQVDADQVRLAARLKYTVRGAKAFNLEVELPGWEIDDVGPSDLVDANAALSDEESTLTLPLFRPATGEFEVTIHAHRMHSKDTSTLTLALPVPKADVYSPADVVIVPGDNVELSPQTDLMAGMSRQLVLPQVTLPVRQQEPLFYRAEVPQANFTSNFSVHAQTLSADVRSQANVHLHDCEVQQHLQFHVAYEPIDRLRLVVPRELAAPSSSEPSPTLKFSIDGTEVPATSISSTKQNADFVRLEIALSRPRIGNIELLASYTVPHPRPLPSASLPLELPLLMPHGLLIVSNTISLNPDVGITVDPRGGTWKPATEDEIASGPTIRLSAQQPASEVSLALSADQNQISGQLVVERAWIQSWLTETGRQDRAVYQFVSPPDEVLRIKRPEGIEACEFLLDGAKITPAVDSTTPNQVTIEAPGTRGQTHVLEMQYRFTDRGSQGNIALSAPQLDERAWIHHAFWQIVLPPDEHLLTSPDNLTSEYRWVWSGRGWSRQAPLGQAELEQWSGAIHDSVAPANWNTYLFSGPLDKTASISTARRPLLVFIASLLVLGLGLGWMYYPPARRRVVLLPLAVAAVALGVVMPGPMLVIGQAAVLGVVLWLVALLLRSLLVRAAPPAYAPLLTNINAQRSSTQMYYREGAPQPVAPAASGSTAASRVLIESPDTAP